MIFSGAKVDSPAASGVLHDCADLQRRVEADIGPSDTLREILQQPDTWRVTGAQMIETIPSRTALLEGVRALLLSGSGSSEYVGECVRAALQDHLGVSVQTLSSGALLTNGSALLPLEQPALMISFARSGDSPESTSALSSMLNLEPRLRHLVITCNAEGRLGTLFQDDARVQTVVLDRKTNDRSLVMTSSFTNMALAALALGWQNDAVGYRSVCEALAAAAVQVLGQSFAQLTAVSHLPFDRALFLSGVTQRGAAREAALKMTEMTAGRVLSFSETYLGLRHGPMSAVNDRTLVICFLSSNPIARRYEQDLIEELNTKCLGLGKILVGSDLPRELMFSKDVAIEADAFAQVGDDASPILHVLVGQVLAFYRCLHEGLQPDSPSERGVIHRVVQSFRIHGPAVLARSAE